jgi:hypothetical protein
MTRIDKVLKNLSELYEFHRKLKAYELKKGANRVREGFSPALPTPPGMRVRTRRFPEDSEP